MQKRNKNMSKKKRQLRNQTIKYNIINSLIAGGLVLFGTFSDGSITWQGFLTALGAAGVVALNNFKEFWQRRGKKTVPKNCKEKRLFQFI